MKNRSLSPEFKIEAASLVLDQGYTFKEASAAVNVSDSALRKWVAQLKKERNGETPTKSKAFTPDQRRIQELEAKVKRLEREKEILKKASALLMTDTVKQI